MRLGADRKVVQGVYVRSRPNVWRCGNPDCRKVLDKGLGPMTPEIECTDCFWKNKYRTMTCVKYREANQIWEETGKALSRQTVKVNAVPNPRGGFRCGGLECDGQLPNGEATFDVLPLIICAKCHADNRPPGENLSQPQASSQQQASSQLETSSQPQASSQSGVTYTFCNTFLNRPSGADGDSSADMPPRQTLLNQVSSQPHATPVKAQKDRLGRWVCGACTHVLIKRSNGQSFNVHGLTKCRAPCSTINERPDT